MDPDGGPRRGLTDLFEPFTFAHQALSEPSKFDIYLRLITRLVLHVHDVFTWTFRAASNITCQANVNQIRPWTNALGPITREHCEERRNQKFVHARRKQEKVRRPIFSHHFLFTHAQLRTSSVE